MWRLCILLLAVNLVIGRYPFQDAFEKAYQRYKSIPKGILEAHAWVMTRITFVHPAIEPPSCIGLPIPYGPMGLFLETKQHFRANLITVAKLSGYPIEAIKNDPETNILAYAAAFERLKKQWNIQSNHPQDHLPILKALSELPLKTPHDHFVMDLYLYEVLKFLNNPQFQQQYNFPDYNIDLKKVFGKNYAVLSSSWIIMTKDKIQTQNGITYQVQKGTMGPDYPPAIWDPAPSCNYSSRNGTPISAVTIHTIQGTYAGAISWFKNCSANVSAHYVLRSSDGQVTQMVLEADKAWHVGTENPYTIGLEHEGYISQPQVWYTDTMYKSSADLVRDICNSGYGISPLTTYFGPGCSGSSPQCLLKSCVRIKGHQHYPNQTHTDPGPGWDWDYYYKLINDPPVITTLTASSGVLYDSGGPIGNYSDNERSLWLIAPPGASAVVLTFTAFDLENNNDRLYIYDGDNVYAPLIGVYTGNNLPGTVIATSGKMLLEFRSDCSTNAAGWEAQWQAMDPDTIPPTTQLQKPLTWQKQDYIQAFQDEDPYPTMGIAHRFWIALTYQNNQWQTKSDSGFLYELCQSLNAWTIQTGTWNVQNGVFVQSDETLSNTNLYTPLQQDSNFTYLFHWKMNIAGSGTNRRAGLHFFCDDPTLSNRGNSYFVYYRVDHNTVQIYRVTNNTWTLQAQGNATIDPNRWYDCKVIYNPQSGLIQAYLNDSLITQWIDPAPLKSGIALSLRTGNALVQYDSIFVYRSRTTNVWISTQLPSSLFPVDATSYTQRNAKVLSIVQDSAMWWSAPTYDYLKLDWTPPITDLSNLPPLITQDSVYTFLDSDNIGIQRAFYLAADYDGSYWGSNRNLGFLEERFGTLSDWVSQTGTWTLQNGSVFQSDETLSNTNLWIDLQQDSTTVYLYRWRMRMGGSGNNRRAGLHFFCDDPTLSNRGNSYFVYYRVDHDKVQIYKVTNNTWVLEAEGIATIDPNQWYWCTVLYDPSTGLIEAWLNDQRITWWIDNNPLKNGIAVSLRTGNAQVFYDSLRVYKGRSSTIAITLGPTAMFRYNGINTALLASAVMDSAGNWDFQQQVFSVNKISTQQIIPQQLTLQVFPNPAKEQIGIRVSEEIQGIIRCFNSKGQQLWERAVQGTTWYFPTTSLAPGLYWISIETRQGVLWRSFVKIK